MMRARDLPHFDSFWLAQAADLIAVTERNPGSGQQPVLSRTGYTADWPALGVRQRKEDNTPPGQG
jgi:hypothetical protein